MINTTMKKIIISLILSLSFFSSCFLDYQDDVNASVIIANKTGIDIYYIYIDLESMPWGDYRNEYILGNNQGLTINNLEPGVYKMRVDRQGSVVVDQINNVILEKGDEYIWKVEN